MISTPKRFRNGIARIPLSYFEKDDIKSVMEAVYQKNKEIKCIHWIIQDDIVHIIMKLKQACTKQKFFKVIGFEMNWLQSLTTIAQFLNINYVGEMIEKKTIQADKFRKGESNNLQTEKCEKNSFPKNFNIKLGFEPFVLGPLVSGRQSILTTLCNFLRSENHSLFQTISGCPGCGKNFILQTAMNLCYQKLSKYCIVVTNGIKTKKFIKDIACQITRKNIAGDEKEIAGQMIDYMRDSQPNTLNSNNFLVIFDNADFLEKSQQCQLMNLCQLATNQKATFKIIFIVEYDRYLEHFPLKVRSRIGLADAKLFPLSKNQVYQIIASKKEFQKLDKVVINYVVTGTIQTSGNWWDFEYKLKNLLKEKDDNIEEMVRLDLERMKITDNENIRLSEAQKQEAFLKKCESKLPTIKKNLDFEKKIKNCFSESKVAKLRQFLAIARRKGQDYFLMKQSYLVMQQKFKMTQTETMLLIKEFDQCAILRLSVREPFNNSLVSVRKALLEFENDC